MSISIRLHRSPPRLAPPAELSIQCTAADFSGSISGHSFVNALVPLLPTTHRILLIDASDVAYHPIASLRASVKEGMSFCLAGLRPHEPHD